MYLKIRRQRRFVKRIDIYSIEKMLLASTLGSIGANIVCHTVDSAAATQRTASTQRAACSRNRVSNPECTIHTNRD